MRRSAAISLLVGGWLLFATPAWAPFHAIVIEEAFFGTAGAPDAQYVQLRMLASGQVFVQGQFIAAQNADGSPAGTFGTFALPNPHSALKGARILVGTQQARDLLCVAMDKVFSGRLVFPDGRFCYGIFPTEFTDSVDCLAYGNYTGDREIFGEPAVAPPYGKALVLTNGALMCRGGTQAGNPCVDTLASADCPDGGACQLNVDNRQAFAPLDPSPRNNAGGMGHIDGTPGDPDGTGVVSIDNLGDEVAVLFEASRRCDVTDPARRGADANVDTRISVADVTATIKIALPGAG